MNQHNHKQDEQGNVVPVEDVVEQEKVETEAGEEVALAEEAPEEQGEGNELDVLQTQLAEAEAQRDEYLDGWQRARAEFANYRRREEQRRAQIDQEIRAAVIKRLLPVLDDMERAFQAVPADSLDSPWVEGLTLVGQKLQSTLEKEGLSAMSVEPGDRFDPSFHEAVLCEPSTEYAEGQIIQVLQQGYRLGKSVLRPALVRVSSGQVEGTDE